LGAAAEAMRRILIARRRAATNPASRRGARRHLDVGELKFQPCSRGTNPRSERSLAVSPCSNRARLKKTGPSSRYFVDWKIDEARDVLGISVATAKRWWAYARACCS